VAEHDILVSIDPAFGRQVAADWLVGVARIALEMQGSATRAEHRDHDDAQVRAEPEFAGRPRHRCAFVLAGRGVRAAAGQWALGRSSFRSRRRTGGGRSIMEDELRTCCAASCTCWGTIAEAEEARMRMRGVECRRWYAAHWTFAPITCAPL
jgi:hypothetical protein